MKKLLAGSASLVLLITAACNQPAKTEKTSTLKSLDYVITSKTSKNNLDSLTAALAKDSIDLKFSKVEFDSTGRLSKIAGTLNFIGKKMSGSFTSDSIVKKPFEIKLSDTSEYFGDKK
ncbi:MAG TPA: hypothetical protein VK808_00265 [Bacteroidia bacterium]|nr:hypothetical protein [Bacteroidia bacterium]